MINRVIQYQNEECIIIHNETLCIKCRNNQMQWFNKFQKSYENVKTFSFQV